MKLAKGENVILNVEEIKYVVDSGNGIVKITFHNGDFLEVKSTIQALYKSLTTATHV